MSETSELANEINNSQSVEICWLDPLRNELKRRYLSDDETKLIVSALSSQDRAPR
jgi:hypothetical protein